VEPETLEGIDHLTTGGIYSVYIKSDEEGRARFYLTKIVALEVNVVHIVVYHEDFLTRPTAEKVPLSSVCFDGDMDIDEARSRHLAVSRRLFSLMRPVYFGQAALTDAELSGYRRWKIMDSADVMDAPPTFKGGSQKDTLLRIFLVYGIPFGALQGAWFFFHHGFFMALLVFCLSAAIFGGGMVLTQRLGVIRRLKKSPGNDPLALTEAMSAFQMAETRLPVPISKAFKQCRQAISSIKNVRITLEDALAGTIEAEVKTGLSAEGESISIALYQIDSGNCGVVVTSVPRKGGELDMGKNHENVRAILDMLEKSSMAI
jgi:hypothetical protein